MTLTGDNGIISRTIGAKQSTKVAEFRENARLEYEAHLIDKYTKATETSFEDLIYILKTKYKYEIVNPGTSGSNEIDTITLSSTEEALEVGGDSTTVTVNIKYEEGEGEDYYLVSDGKYYAITPSTKNGLDVANEPSDIDTSSTANGNETITANSDNEKISAVVSGKTITISSESTTSIQNAKVTIKVNNESFTNNVITVAVKQLSKLDSLNVSSLVLDGASLVTATILDGSNKKLQQVME